MARSGNCCEFAVDCMSGICIGGVCRAKSTDLNYEETFLTHDFVLILMLTAVILCMILGVWTSICFMRLKATAQTTSTSLGDRQYTVSISQSRISSPGIFVDGNATSVQKLPQPKIESDMVDQTVQEDIDLDGPHAKPSIKFDTEKPKFDLSRSNKSLDATEEQKFDNSIHKALSPQYIYG